MPFVNAQAMFLHPILAIAALLGLWLGLGVYLFLGFLSWRRTQQQEREILNQKNFRSHTPLVEFGLKSLGATVLVIVASITFLRPILGEQNTPGSRTNLDIAIVMDISKSMLVFDYPNKQTRLTGSSQFLSNLVQQGGSNRFSLITFNQKAHTELPLTFDKKTVQTGLKSLENVDPQNSQSSLISTGLLEAKVRLNSPNDPFKNTRQQVVLLVSDGELIGEDKAAVLQTIDELTSAKITVFTLGVGTTAGDKVPSYIALNGDVFWQRYQGKEVISKLDEANLQAFAQQGKGDYLLVQPSLQPQTVLDSVARKVPVINQLQDQDVPVFQEGYYYSAGLLLVLLLLMETKAFWRGKLLYAYDQKA
jgi:Ca-activated chloride channel family protein